MHADAATMIWLAISPITGLIALVLLARLLRRRWLPDVDAATSAVLAAVLVAACWLIAFHLYAFARMPGWLSGLSVPGITILFLILLGATFWAMSHNGPLEVRCTSVTMVRWSWLDWSCLIPVILLHVVLLIEALTRMPTGHDALKYRLPMVVAWLRADALIMKPDIWQFCQPANGELVLWWLLKGGAERLASAAYFPAGLLLGAAVWAIVRLQRGSHFARVLAVVIVLSTYMVVWQMYNSYIDLFGTAFLASGILALLLAIGQDRSRPVRRLLFIVAGLAIGIALGTKPTNWLLSLFAAVLLLGVHLYRNRREHDLAFVLPAFTAACLACSAFWFVRAGVTVHNPFYPIRVAVGDHVLLEGIRFDTQYEIYEGGDKPIALPGAAPDGWIQQIVRLATYAVTLNMLTGGVGPLFTTFVPIALLTVVAGFVLRGRRAMRHHRLMLVALTAGVFLLWVGPLCHYARFGMLYLVLAVCVAAPAIGRMYRYWPSAIGLASLVATCLGCAVLAAIPAKVLGMRMVSRNLSRSACYGLPDVIDQWPEGTRVVNLSHWSGASRLTYPLCGRGLKNDVIDYMTTQRLFPDMKPTVEQLQELRVDYIVVCKPFRTDWPTDPRLEMIYNDSSTPSRTVKWLPARIYRVPPRVTDDDRVAVVGKSD